MDICEIVQAIQDGQIRITDHAFEEAEDDGLTLDEIYLSVFRVKLLKTMSRKISLIHAA